MNMIRQNRTALAGLLTVMAMTVGISSCDNIETYAEQKEYEHDCINSFIYGNCRLNKRPINVISEETFKAQGETTDTARNEYVLFNSSGIYMQIVDKGCGEKIKKGESADVICRYFEYNINGDSLQSFNTGAARNSITCDKMTVMNTSGTFTATFTGEKGTMAITYGSTSVPLGWLTPLSYVNVGRPADSDDKIAHVRIIVPHDQGTTYASTKVYACFYDITYQRGI